MDSHDTFDDDESYDSDQDESTDEQSPPSCAACDRPIDETFYVLNNMHLCPTCRDTIVSGEFGGSKIRRVFRALGLGVAAAIAGAILYYGILTVSGLHFGLIAIVVGVLVGKAVQRGSEGRGGLFYQLMAVLLTYSSIAGTNIPMILTAVRERAVVAKADKAAEAKQNPAPAEKKRPPSLVKLVAAVVLFSTFLMVFAMIIPILAAIDAPFLLIILRYRQISLMEGLRRRVVS